ncbi:40S ribosomal protein S12 [Cucumispora dikerogammari]|nr:40S ribosomal protein S12 [Cucumispora dikerogammari]
MTTTEIPFIPSELTLTEALTRVTKVSRSRNKITIGANQVSRELLKKQSKLVVIDSQAPNNIKEIIILLAKQSNTPIINVDNIQDVCGLTRVKLDMTTKAPKVICYSINDYVKETVELKFLMKEITH